MSQEFQDDFPLLTAEIKCAPIPRHCLLCHKDHVSWKLMVRTELNGIGGIEEEVGQSQLCFFFLGEEGTAGRISFINLMIKLISYIYLCTSVHVNPFSCLSFSGTVCKWSTPGAKEYGQKAELGTRFEASRRKSIHVDRQRMCTFIVLSLT